MNLNLSGHHLDITPAIRAYVTSKLERRSATVSGTPPYRSSASRRPLRGENLASSV